jgi:hypothetical protein
MIRLGRFGAVAILAAGVGLALLGVQREMYPFAAVTGVASLLLSAPGSLSVPPPNQRSDTATGINALTSVFR